jgi:hypothetical protein
MEDSTGEEKSGSSNIGRAMPSIKPTQHLAHELMMSAKMEGFKSFTRIEKIQDVKATYGEMQIVEDEVWEISVKLVNPNN